MDRLTSKWTIAVRPCAKNRYDLQHLSVSWSSDLIKVMYIYISIKGSNLKLCWHSSFLFLILACMAELVLSFNEIVDELCVIVLVVKSTPQTTCSYLFRAQERMIRNVLVASLSTLFYPSDRARSHYLFASFDCSRLPSIMGSGIYLRLGQISYPSHGLICWS